MDDGRAHPAGLILGVIGRARLHQIADSPATEPPTAAMPEDTSNLKRMSPDLHFLWEKYLCRTLVL
jgi:hypothetical protein